MSKYHFSLYICPCHTHTIQVNPESSYQKLIAKLLWCPTPKGLDSFQLPELYSYDTPKAALPLFINLKF
jgi:hypothetical protein